MADMLDELAPTLEARAESRPFVLVSMAAGLSMQQIRHMAGSGYPIIRMMPNTPVALGAGMIQYCCDDVGPAQLQEWLAAMQPAGRLDEVPETLIDAASAVSGCGPAWVYQFIEALADGGVAAGLPRAKAQEYAAQMVLGSARMVLESGSHPGALERRRVQSRRVHHPGCAPVGRTGLPRCCDRRRAGRLRENERVGKVRCELLLRSAQAPWPTRVGG